MEGKVCLWFLFGGVLLTAIGAAVNIYCAWRNRAEAEELMLWAMELQDLAERLEKERRK